MIFILGKVPPRVNLEQTDPRSADVESELQHTMLKERRLELYRAFEENLIWGIYTQSNMGLIQFIHIKINILSYCEVPWAHTQKILLKNNSGEIRLFQVGSFMLLF